MTGPLMLVLALTLAACGGAADPHGEAGRVTADGLTLSRNTSRLTREMDRHADGPASPGAAADLVQALARLAEQPTADAVPYLQTLAAHTDEEVRFNVVLALKSVGGEQARATLATMAADDASELVRFEAGVE